jgi:hypothetical protein
MANDDAQWALGTDLWLGSLDFVFNEAGGGGGPIIGEVFPAPER